MNLSLDQSEGSVLSDDFLETPDDLDINVDDIETPDETDSLEFINNGNDLEWEGEILELWTIVWSFYGVLRKQPCREDTSSVSPRPPLFRRHSCGHSQASSRRRRGGEGLVWPSMEDGDYRRSGATDWHAGHQAVPKGRDTWRLVPGHVSVSLILLDSQTCVPFLASYSSHGVCRVKKYHLN